jgi:hypothetical protein
MLICEIANLYTKFEYADLPLGKPCINFFRSLHIQPEIQYF